MDTPDSTPNRTCRKCGKEYPATKEYFRTSSGILTRKCIPCDRARSRAYYRLHAQKLRDYQNAYREANLELVRERKKEYYLKNADKLRTKAIYYRNRDIEKARAYDRKRGKERREKHNEYNRKWKKLNPEVSRKESRRRRALKHRAEGTHTPKDIELLMRSQKGLCWWCGAPIHGKKYDVDHRIPLNRGGSNAPENLCITCPSCNRSKQDKLPQEWNGRLL